VDKNISVAPFSVGSLVPFSLDKHIGPSHSFCAKQPVSVEVSRFCSTLRI